MDVFPDYDQEALFESFLGSKQVIHIEENSKDLEFSLFNELRRARKEASFEEQVIYLVKLSDLFLLRKDWTRAAKIMNCAVAILQKHLQHPKFEQFLFYRLESIEIQFLESQGIQTAYKHQNIVESYRSWLKNIRSGLVEQLKQQVDTQKLLNRLTLSYRELLTALILNSQKLIGPPPVKWACLGLGSMARAEMCPYSDIDFVFLIQEETRESMEYFLLLTQLVELKIINLGETKFPIFGEGEESPTPDGFCLDVGGNTPYGNRDTYTLIGTPKNLSKFQRQDWVKENIILSNAMGSTCLVVGDKTLFEKYLDEKSAILGEKASFFAEPHRKSFAMSLLKGHLAEFSPDLSKEKEELSAFGIKKELYRPFQEILASLSLFYQVEAVNTFDRIDELTKKGIFSPEGANNLKKAIAQVLTFRLEAHLFYQEEKEFLCHLKKNEPFDPHLMYFNESTIQILQSIYHILIPFHHCAEQFFISQDKNAFNCSNFNDENSQEQGLEFYKGLHYIKAQKALQQTVALNPNDLYPHLYLGMIEGEMGHKREVLSRFLKALDLAKQNNAKNSDVVSCHNNVGTAYHALGEYEKALESYHKSLELLSEDDPSVGPTYSNIGVVYKDLGEYRKALEYLQMDLNILTIDIDPIGYAKCAGNIGSVYNLVKEYDVALKWLEEALEISQIALEENHPDIAKYFTIIGASYDGLERYDESLKHYERALEIRLCIFSDVHPDVAINYNNIGKAYEGLENYGKAIENHEKALEIQLKNPSENHSDLAKTYMYIGYSCKQIGKYDKALKCYNKNLQILLKNLKPDHPDLALRYENLGSIYNRLENNEKALKYYRKSLKIYLKTFEEDHPSLASIYTNIGQALWKRDKCDQSLEYFQKALKSDLRSGENHLSVGISYNNVCQILYKLGKNEEALIYHKKAIEVYFSNISDPSAIPILKNIIHLAKKIPSSSHIIFQEFYLRFVEKLGKEHPISIELLSLKK